MTAPHHVQALDYFRAPRDASWRWAEDARVLVLAGDGSTIAFREEIKALLGHLAPDGLPPFPALVIVLAACRGLKTSPLASEHAPELAIIDQLPYELVAETGGKALLLDAIFETSVRFSPAESAHILRAFEHGFPQNDLNTPHPSDPGAAAPFGTPRVLQLISQCLRRSRHTAESLQLRLRTGLDALPQSAPPIGLPRGESSRRLLDALETSEQHAGLAHVVRDLMAALQLPRVIVPVDESACGGISDIGNRGPLDRLLLSELAHDDLTLTARLALNEALYLRREPPATRPRRALALLLDSGLRMWGAPRVTGAAAALAFVNRHDDNAALMTWRADGRRLAPVDLLSQGGLEAHLAALTTELHPGDAVPALREKISGAGAVDVVIITHGDALADAAFQAQLAQAGFERGFLVVVGNDGLVQLHALPWGSPRPLAQVRIGIERLFPKNAAAHVTPGARDPDELADLPAIFRERVFPLLLPVRGKVARIIRAGKEGACVTNDGCLFHWREALGARCLGAGLPKGHTHWLHIDHKKRVIAIKGKTNGRGMSVIIARTDGGAPDVVRFASADTGMFRDAWVDQHVLVIVLHANIVVVSLDMAEVMANVRPPQNARHINERYWENPENDANIITFASWNGAALEWRRLHENKNNPAKPVLHVFDRKGEGGWMFLRDGHILAPSCKIYMTSVPLASVHVLNDGELFAGQHVETGAWQRIDLPRRTTSADPHAQYLHTHANGHPPVRNLQRNFRAIHASPDQGILLCTGKGKWRAISQKGQCLHLIDAKQDQISPETSKVARVFAQKPIPTGFNCSLRIATWPGGSAAWLDNRGLLYLRSHNPEAPEITLTLDSSGGALAAWCGNGAVCGPDFFFDEKPNAGLSRVISALNDFCNNLC
jgi:hypothetical protein